MTLQNLVDLPQLETLYLTDPQLTLSAGYTSDLLSDVMARAPAESVLITIQAHRNTIAVGAMVGARAVIICNRRDVPEEMLAAAREEQIAIFRTRENQFQTSCRVHEALS